MQVFTQNWQLGRVRATISRRSEVGKEQPCKRLVLFSNYTRSFKIFKKSIVNPFLTSFQCFTGEKEDQMRNGMKRQIYSQSGMMSIVLYLASQDGSTTNRTRGQNELLRQQHNEDKMTCYRKLTRPNKASFKTGKSIPPPKTDLQMRKQNLKIILLLRKSKTMTIVIIFSIISP